MMKSCRKFIIMMILCRNKRKQKKNGKKLVFVGNSPRVFGLKALLNASAEVLGEGTFGTTYKAVLDDGKALAFKRLKHVSISEIDFKEKIVRVGALDHKNLVPLTAYHYNGKENLLVYDYRPMGSLSALLHGDRARRNPLNFDIRCRIALGAARGIQYLHSQGDNVYHGNIKSSNILLNSSYEAQVADFGLIHLLGPSTPNLAAGYQAPEVTDPRYASQDADVYSFGVLLLELLTGKSATPNEEGLDLPGWIRAVVNGQIKSEIFDLEVLIYPNSKDDRIKLLDIAIDCTAKLPVMRPSMSNITEDIEKLVEKSTGGSCSYCNNTLFPLCFHHIDNQEC